MDRKYIILKHNRKILSLLYHGNRLLHAKAEMEQGNLLGNIYIAKVKNIVKNINAAFVEIKPGCPCFLSLNGLKNPLITNRAYDGRVLDGDEIVVQVYKEAAKTKTPTVTCSLSLDGKYCVAAAGRPGVSYSTKLSDKAKKRIGDFLAQEGFLEAYSQKTGIIIRTNAKDLTEDLTPLKEEIRTLTEQLHHIMEIANHRTCYSVLFEQLPAYLTGIRDEYEGQYEEIVTDRQDIYDSVVAYCNENAAFPIPAIRLYQDELVPLYKLYSVETRLKEALNKKVWLKSGGYLIIEPTEALTVIDVNTGKLVAGKDMEETYLRTNLEAAREIALQMALRNLSGMIIVDFINMSQEENNKKLMDFLRGLLRKDPVRTQLMDITALGLVEITRMKMSKPLKEQLIFQAEEES